MKPKIIIAGGTGLVGNLLTNHFKEKYEIVILSRNHHQNKGNIRYVKWDGITLEDYWARELDGAYAVINLNGKSVDCRYNQQNKDGIYETRVKSTYAIGKAIAQCEHPPQVWLNASTATIYRDSQTPNNEQSKNIGGDFSMDVAQKWEEEFFRAETPNSRKVALRMAIILSEKGGAYVPLKKIIQLGFGGKQASGKQMVSWITDTDLVSAIDYLMHNESSQGVYNLSSPNPIPNQKFMQILRSKNHRKFGLPMPKFLLNFGAKIIKTEPELILKSRYVVPEKLLNEGFNFQHKNLESWK